MQVLTKRRPMRLMRSTWGQAIIRQVCVTFFSSILEINSVPSQDLTSQYRIPVAFCIIHPSWADMILLAKLGVLMSVDEPLSSLGDQGPLFQPHISSPQLQTPLAILRGDGSLADNPCYFCTFVAEKEQSHACLSAQQPWP